MRRVIPAVILLAAAIGAGLYLYPRLTRKPAPQDELVLSGNVEAHESLVSFKVLGRVVELPIEEGQQVAEGTILARLEDADRVQRVRVDEANVGVRQANLALTLAAIESRRFELYSRTCLTHMPI